MKQAFIIIFSLASLTAFSQKPSITYIANEGVLIECGDKKVLI